MANADNVQKEGYCYNQHQICPNFCYILEFIYPFIINIPMIPLSSCVLENYLSHIEMHFQIHFVQIISVLFIPSIQHYQNFNHHTCCIFLCACFILIVQLAKDQVLLQAQASNKHTFDEQLKHPICMEKSRVCMGIHYFSSLFLLKA